MGAQYLLSRLVCFEMQTTITLGKLELFSDQLPAQLDQNEDEGKAERLGGSHTL